MSAVDDIHKLLQDGVTPDLKALKVRIAALEKKTDARIDSLEKKMDLRFDHLDQKLDLTRTHFSETLDLSIKIILPEMRASKASLEGTMLQLK